jgi:hypothetical protein
MVELIAVEDRVDNRQEKIRRLDMQDLLKLAGSLKGAAEKDAESKSTGKLKDIKHLIPFDRDEDVKHFFLDADNVRALDWFFRCLEPGKSLANKGITEFFTPRYMAFHMWSDRNLA